MTKKQVKKVENEPEEIEIKQENTFHRKFAFTKYELPNVIINSKISASSLNSYKPFLMKFISPSCR